MQDAHRGKSHTPIGTSDAAWRATCDQDSPEGAQSRRDFWGQGHSLLQHVVISPIRGRRPLLRRLDRAAHLADFDGSVDRCPSNDRKSMRVCSLSLCVKNSTHRDFRGAGQIFSATSIIWHLLHEIDFPHQSFDGGDSPSHEALHNGRLLCGICSMSALKRFDPS